MRTRHRQAVSSALQLVAAAAMLGIAHAQPTPATQLGAREAYGTGLAEFARGDYEAAAVAFARADALAESPNAKLMLARCLRHLDRLPEAYRALHASLSLAERDDTSRYAQTAAAARDDLDALRKQIGFLTIFVHTDPGPGQLHVDGVPVPPSEWQAPLPVRAGTIYVSLETASGAIERRSIEVGAGQSARLVIGTPSVDPLPPPAAAPAPPPARPVEPEPEAPPLRIASYVIGGAGVAGLIAFGVLGSLSAAAFDELEERCPIKAQCDPSLQEVAERGEQQQAAANVALVAGLSALALGVTLFVVSEPEVRARERVAVSAGPSGVSVEAAF